MSLLPVVVPAIPEARAEIVPARLARKVAPLFSVAWPDSPFGTATWVSDFQAITLSEIARGAPLPTRSQVSALRDQAPHDGWALVDRIGVTGPAGALPNEIANATLNRFGPDTKAAVVLTGVNRLIEPLRAGLEDAIALLVDESGKPLSPGLKLAAWAGVLVEVFRSQPALLVAAIHARAIQRPLTVVLEAPLSHRLDPELLTRCEIGAPRGTVAPSRPRDLDIVDATLRRQSLLDLSSLAPVTREDTYETIAGRLLSQLLTAATLRDDSHLWISEREPGQWAYEALMSPMTIVDRFVRRALADAHIDDPILALGGPLPAVPDPHRLGRLPLLTRRTIVIAMLGVIRQLLASETAREGIRPGVPTWLELLRRLVETVLPDDDPVRAIAVCRIDLTRLQLQRVDVTNDVSASLDRLAASTEHCRRLFDAGRLDRGAAAEIVSASNVEVDTLRRVNAGRPGSGLPAPAELDRQVRDRWRHWLAMVEIEPDVLRDLAELPELLAYHLNNYASYLGTHDDEDDLREAVRLFESAVLPARERFVARLGIFDPVRNSAQMASAAASALARRALARGDRPEAARWAAKAHGWISRVLDHPSTRAMLEATTELSARFALRAADALVIAAETGVPGVEPGVAEAADLIATVRRWESAAMGDTGRYVRHDEVEALAARIDLLRGGPGAR
ncbi:hypothetical protein [Frankia sp. Cj3]|uniref:hypothetical protein n=1 Tax=Frankia sp. Cj3 TaxID=2880976 RepID=UPI001EF6B30F|nr:hypothetical protein [Frankia sp. Cj3]